MVSNMKHNRTELARVNGQEKQKGVDPLGENRALEPVAVVGMGCRFPGDANGPESYWKILRDGIDALVEVPSDRWDMRTFYDPEPGKTGKTNVKYGGFIKDIDKFDAHFFGISPREAARMDV